MYCKKCNYEISDAAKFCPVCGAGCMDSKTAYNIENDSDSLISDIRKSSNFSSSDYFRVNYICPDEKSISEDFGEAVTADTVQSKKKNGVKARIIIAAAAVLLTAVALLLFTNKASFLSAVMGKENYAAMIEGNHIGQTLGNMDMQAVSDRISSISEVYSALLAADSSKLDTSMEQDSNIDSLKLSNTYFDILEDHLPIKDLFPTGSVDIKAAAAAYNKMLGEVFGTNAVTVTTTGNIELTDTAKSLLGNNIADISEIIEKINNSTVTYETAASDNSIGFSRSIESGTVKIDAKTIVDSDGSVYLIFPFVSDKGLKLKVDSANNSSAKQYALELDPEEIKSLLSDVIRTYVEEYAKSTVEMQSGSISAAGLEANGKLITAVFDSDKLEKLLEKIGTQIADNKYLRDKILSFAEDVGAELSEAEYKEKIAEIFDLDTNKIGSLTINTVVDRGGNVIAKSYEVVCGDDDKAMLSYIDGSDQYSLEINKDGKILSIINEKNTDKDGELSVKLISGSKTINTKVEYSDIEKAEFGNVKICTGTCKISVVLPTDFSDSLRFGAVGAISGASLTVSNYLEDNVLKTEFIFDLPKYGTVKTLTTVSPKNNDILLQNIPSDVIEITPAADGTLDEETQKQIKEYFKNISDKVQNMDPQFSGILKDLLKKGHDTVITYHPALIDDLSFSQLT